MLPTSGLISNLVDEANSLKGLVNTPEQATIAISSCCRTFKMFESRFSQDYDLFNFFSTNECFNTATRVSMQKCASKLDQLKQYLDKQGIKDLGIIRHNYYVEHSDIVSETKGLLYKTLSDILFIEKESYLRFVNDISKTFQMFDSFNRKTAENCVDTMKAKEICELFNSGLEMEYQKNVVLDFTSRFTAYKKVLKDSSILKKIAPENADREAAADTPLRNLLLKVQDDKFFGLASKYRAIAKHLLSKLHVFLHVFDDVKEVLFVNELETQSLSVPKDHEIGHALSETGNSSNYQSPPSDRVVLDSKVDCETSQSIIHPIETRAGRVSSAINTGQEKSTRGVNSDRNHAPSQFTAEQDGSKTDDPNCLTPPKKVLTNASTSARVNLEKDSNSKKQEQRFRTEVDEPKPGDQIKGFQMDLGSPGPFCANTSKKTIIKNIEEVLEIQIESRYNMRSSIDNYGHSTKDFNRILDLETVDELSSHTGVRDSVKSKSSALRSDDNLQEFELFNRSNKPLSKLPRPAGKEYCNPCTLI